MMAATLALLLFFSASAFAFVVLTMSLRESGGKILDALGMPALLPAARNRRGRFTVTRRRPSVVRVPRAWSVAA